MKKLVLSVAVVSLALTGCSWVKPEAGSEQVRILTSEQVAECKKLGFTMSYTKHEIAGLQRNEETVNNELYTLAKNQATKMGGDTIVPQGVATDGQRNFDIYRCQH